MAKKLELFVASTPLEERVLAGDYEGALAYLAPLSVAERARHRASTKRMVQLMRESMWRYPEDGGLQWPMRSTEPQDRAGHAALLLCGTADDIGPTFVRAPDVLPLLGRFEIPALPHLAEAWLASSPRLFEDVQALVVAGAVPRPTSDAYVLGLIDLPQPHRGRPQRTRAVLDADPGLLDVVPRMFEVEGNADFSLASTDKYNSDGNLWADHLLALCAEGKLARDDLLDWTLGALERDFPQYRAGWFKGFHERLAPAVDAMASHASRYLHLCHSRIPPTVTLAVDAVAALARADRIAAADVLPALAPVLSTGSKGQVESALKLLDACVARVGGLAASAARLAATALVHESAPLQAKVLQRLEKWPHDDALRAELQRHLPGIAPSHRAKLLALAGGEPTEASLAPVPPVATPTARATPLDEDRIVPAVADLDELVQLVAHVFENDAEVDAFERALGALVAAAPIAPADRARFGPVRKRLARLKGPVAFELGRMLAFVLEGERLEATLERDYFGHCSYVHGQLVRRTATLMDLAARGLHRVPMSTPTHRRGFIAPSTLVDRARAFAEAGVQIDATEQALALLRLAPDATDADRAAARALPDAPFARALRYALGDSVKPGPERALYCAAARIRHPGGDDPVALAVYGDLGPDGPKAAAPSWDLHEWTTDGGYRYFHLRVSTPPHEAAGTDLLAIARHPPSCREEIKAYAHDSLAGESVALIAWSATVVPSDLAAFFAEAARAFGNNLDWWRAQWYNAAYLEPLLDATVDPGELGLLAMACALLGKEPGQAALAVDCLVRLHGDGRLDADRLGTILRRIYEVESVKPARLRRSLDAALRLDPALAPTCVALLATIATADESAPRKDLATLLELLHELLAAGTPPPGSTLVQALARTAFAGTAKSLQKKVLALASG